MDPQILPLLQSVRHAGGSQWYACCPAHDDSKASLGISVGGDGKTILNCLAGCEKHAILRAVNAGWSILFPDRGDQLSRASHGGQSGGSKKSKKSDPVVATYVYRDAAGTVLFEVQRTASKQFPQRYPDPSSPGRWINRKCPTQVLYRLPELIAADPSQPVFICEGEKAANAVAALGLVATSPPGGSGGPWLESYTPHLAGRRVVILEDNDAPGRKKSPIIASAVIATVESVKVLALPGLPEKGDVYDWIQSGGAAEQLLQLAADCKPWTIADAPPAVDELTSITTLEGRTDLANARRLIAWHGEDLRYCHPWRQWLTWDGARWKPDSSALAIQTAAKVSDRLWVDAKAEGESDPDQLKAMIAHAATSSSRASIMAMLSLAAAHAEHIDITEMDQMPFTLNLANGTLDLRSGALLPAARSNCLTKLCPTNYDASATCPLWLRFLSDIFAADADLIEFMRRYLGYCLTGDVSEQILAVLWGEGSNGKSTMLSVVQHVMGEDYAMQASPTLLMAKHGNEHPTALCDLHGKRLVSAVETGEGKTLDEELVKTLTGGDRIRARRMREDNWEFIPTHKIALATNHKPRITGTDHAIWRRIRLVPFTVKFWDPQKGEDGPDNLIVDRSLPDQLILEAPGILNWLVSGCLDWQKSGLQTPESIIAKTNEYQAEEDVIGGFIEECCEVNTFMKVNATSLYLAYIRWSGGPSKAMSQTKFGRRMKTLGYISERSNGVWYAGLALNNDQQERQDVSDNTLGGPFDKDSDKSGWHKGVN